MQFRMLFKLVIDIFWTIVSLLQSPGLSMLSHDNSAGEECISSDYEDQGGSQVTTWNTLLFYLSG